MQFHSRSRHLSTSGLNPGSDVPAGLVFTPCCEPYLASEYGVDYPSDSPTKLLERLLYGFKRKPGEQVVLLSQVCLRAHTRLLCRMLPSSAVLCWVDVRQAAPLVTAHFADQLGTSFAPGCSRVLCLHGHPLRTLGNIFPTSHTAIRAVFELHAIGDCSHSDVTARHLP